MHKFNLFRSSSSVSDRIFLWAH